MPAPSAPNIPHELHLTISSITEDRLADFTACCEAHDAKPILIELAAGETRQQPMLGKVVFVSGSGEALHAAAALGTDLGNEGFSVVRTKIEIPASAAHRFHAAGASFPAYFEWHGKVAYHDAEALLDTALRHHAHLSRNAMRSEHNSRFVTLREGGTLRRFEERVRALEADLLQGGWNILKRESEWCIYDSNINLDNGWLPKQP